MLFFTFSIKRTLFCIFFLMIFHENFEYFFYSIINTYLPYLPITLSIELGDIFVFYHRHYFVCNYMADKRIIGIHIVIEFYF